MRLGRFAVRTGTRYVARRAVYRALPRRGPGSAWRHGWRWAGLRLGVGWGIGRLFRFWR
jgi:hypothetical protein